MIQIQNVSKKFGSKMAIDAASCQIENGSVFGIVGSNGAGKSTLLRLIAGVYKQDEGNVLIDNQNIFDNPQAKKQCVFISDDPYLVHGVSLDYMAKLYSRFYESFSFEEYRRLTGLFNLDPAAQLSGFSKGMRRQAVIILALACKCRYMMMDETLDGLDPIMREFVKKLLYQAVSESGTTVLISSHSLRELEDACDNLAMIHNGKIIFQSDIQGISSTVSKVQIVLEEKLSQEDLEGIDILNYSTSGSVSNLIVRGGCEKVLEVLEKKDPLLLEVLPLTLEEVFTYELRQKGYSFDDVFENGGEANEG